MSLDVPAPALTPAALSPAPAAPPSRTLKANFAINVAGALVPLAVSLVTVPIYIRHIGDARYGVLSIVWVLLGYFGFLDLGLSRAAANALARLRDAPQEARARVLVTTLVLNLGMGLIGSLALALAGSYLLQHVLNVPEALKPEIASAFPWIVALFPLALVSGVGIGALESREEFLRANFLQVVGTSLGQIVPVMLAVGVGPSLAVVIPAAAIVRGLTAATIIALVINREGPLRSKHFDREQAQKLIRYGGWITVSNLVSPLFASLDQFTIGSVLGVGAVAHYSIPMNIVTRTQIIPGSLSRTLFPRMSGKHFGEAQELALKATLAVSFGYATLCAPFIILSPHLLRVWLGSDFERSASFVAIILLVGAWVNGSAFVSYGFLQSQNRPEVIGKIQMLELIPAFALLFVLSEKFGIEGASIAFLVRCTFEAFVFFRFAGLEYRALGRLAYPAAVVICSAGIAFATRGAPLFAISSAILAAGLITILGVVTVPELRNVLERIYNRFPHMRARGSLVASGIERAGLDDAVR